MDLIELSQALLQEQSITPDDGNCQAIIAKLLAANGFSIYPKKINKTNNLLAIKGDTGPTILLLGHTDVVPPGHGWDFEPFAAKIKSDILYGRGAVDMKCAVAAMTRAACNYNFAQPKKIAILLTSDEEGSGHDGIQAVLPKYMAIIGKIDACLVGEPTSSLQLGDTIKLGRRGSINGKITIRGEQGHAAYPDLALNPINDTAAVISVINSIEFADCPGFPTTKICLTGIDSSTNTCNIIPAEVELSINIRYTPNLTPEQIKSTLEQALTMQNVDVKISAWSPSAKPYQKPKGALTQALIKAIQNNCQITPKIAFDGGTSDGRFLAEYCTEVVEFGALNKYAHKANEQITLDELRLLERIYIDCLNLY